MAKKRSSYSKPKLPKRATGKGTGKLAGTALQQAALAGVRPSSGARGEW